MIPEEKKKRKPEDELEAILKELGHARLVRQPPRRVLQLFRFLGWVAGGFGTSALGPDPSLPKDQELSQLRAAYRKLMREKLGLTVELSKRTALVASKGTAEIRAVRGCLFIGDYNTPKRR